jgi:outer membrane protein assembly factor BamB
MNQDFVTQLRIQLREAAVRDERRTPAARRLMDARLRAPRPAVLAAGIAVALLALAAALGALSLRGEPEPTAPKVIHTFRVASGLTSIAHGFGAVWATDLSRGDVLRIDPRTRRVVARVPAGSGTGNGQAVVAAGAGAVWALAGDLQNGGVEGPVRLLRIDPRTNRIVARIPMHKPSGRTFSPQAVRVVDGTVWVIGTAGALQVDPASGTPERYVETRHAELGIVAGGDALWMLGFDGRLRTVDARTGRTVRAIRVPVTTHTYLTGAGPGALMLIADERVTAFNPTDGRVLWRAAFEAPIRFAAPGRDDALWLYLLRTPERHDRLVRVDAGTGHSNGRVSVPDPGAAGLAEVGRELWAASPDGRISVVR